MDESLYKNNCTTKNKRIYYILGIMLIILSVLLDKSFSPDYLAYISYLNNDSIILEPSFTIIKFIINKFGYRESILFSIYAVIGIGIKVYSIPKSTNLIICTLLFYICSYWIYQDLIQIRASVASGIFIYSIPFLVNRNSTKYFIAILIAILFHYSSIVLIPIWFIGKTMRYNYIYMLIIPIAMGLYLLNIDLISILSLIPIEYIQGKIETYKFVSNELSYRGVLTSSEYNPFITWYIIKAMIVELLWINIKSIQRNNKNAVVLLKIFTISISILWLLSGAPAIAARISELLSIVQIILVPLLIYSHLPKCISYMIIPGYGLCWLFWNYSSFFNM